MTSILKNKPLLVNLLIGIGLISIPFLASPDLSSGFDMLSVKGFQQSLLSYTLLVIFFYVNYYVIIPKLYITKKWLLFALTMIVCYLIILKLPQALIQDFNAPPFNPPVNNPFQNTPPPVNGFKKHPFVGLLSRDNYVFQFFGVFILSLFLKFNEHLNEIKNEKLTTEVSYLKAQINPHFLFNTLNSLYALALTKSDKAPNAILKLSDLMRHVVSESNKDYISLEKEIKYIKNFIDLQQLRLNENTKLITNFKGDFNRCKIAPLLLISFIENAFKYGVNTTESSQIFINIEVDHTKLLTLNVENTIVAVANSEVNKPTEKGLKNTKKQLKYLYPNKHDLLISKEADKFRVHLTIQLE
ncbi:sensor histidine kinase [Neotamlana nanhaiensis]|uniref:sensor histidine kinase n=1 Tax=Neotamlana nanhaiensis TaxID=1382798 RepID=UPI00069C4C10|nr:histidine kinase [Tamlana nanhaiensis]